MSEFDGATLMITGGTGSFGNTVLKHFLTTDIGQIRIFSRDEKKQDDMRHELQTKYPEYAGKVKFYIGDVRDPRSVADAMPGVDNLGTVYLCVKNINIPGIALLTAVPEK